MTFFAFPPMWWWGKGNMLTGVRWNLYAGLIALAAVAASKFRPKLEWIGPQRIALLILVNATLVHFLLGTRGLPILDYPYEMLVKFVVLFFLIILCVQNPKDLRFVIITLAVGASYWGFEVVVNGRGAMKAGRLEGIGGPGAENSNAMASCLITILPLVGGLFITGDKREKLLALLACPLLLDLILRCSSRGAMLGMIGGAIVLLVTSRGRLRRSAMASLALAGIGAYMLMGDPQIMRRFLSTFVASEDRDTSAANRLEFWRAGLMMISDRPLGSGGNSFKKLYGRAYLAAIGRSEESASCHNGYINEACEWGIQGVVLRVLFMCSAMIIVYKALTVRLACGDQSNAFLGSCLIASTICFLIAAVFSDYLDNEWGYWIAGLSVAYARLFGQPNMGSQQVIGEKPIHQRQVISQAHA
jgi:O-antigen ligase